MSIEGRISVDVNLVDTSSADGASAAKVISLADVTSYTSGKAAIVTGTCGTAAVTIAVEPSSFVGADGNAVSFTSGVTRVAFSVAGANSRAIYDENDRMKLISHSGMVAVSVNEPSLANDFSIAPPSVQTANTAAYTVVLYGP